MATSMKHDVKDKIASIEIDKSVATATYGLLVVPAGDAIEVMEVGWGVSELLDTADMDVTVGTSGDPNYFTDDTTLTGGTTTAIGTTGITPFQSTANTPSKRTITDEVITVTSTQATGGGKAVVYVRYR